MRNAYCALILLLMLSAPWSSFETAEDAAEPALDEDFPQIEFVRIEPDPNSVRGLSTPELSEGEEIVRQSVAETRIGVFDLDGLNLDREIPTELSQPRYDIVMVIVDGEMGLWDSQVLISDLPGVTIRAHIPPSGFLVQGEPLSLSRLPFVEGVAAVHFVPAALFVADELLDIPRSEDVLVRVQGWRDVTSGMPVDSIQLGPMEHNSSKLSMAVLDEEERIGSGRYEGWLSMVDLSSLALEPGVSWIRLPPNFGLHNNNARTHMAIATAATAFGTTLNGSGEIVAVADTGLDQDHGDMNNRINAVVSVVSGDSSTEDVHSGHGTHVSCTVLGDGSRGGYAGVAPEAELYFQAMQRDSDGAFYSPSMNYLLNAAYNNGARTHTNSWGSQQNYGEYTTDSEDVDDRTNTYDQYWSYEGLTVLFSAGNDGSGVGTVTPPATAKNQIAIGNHHNRGASAPDALADSSSRGPTDDGRIKPDVSAPGTWVRSCRSQDAAQTSGASWTSQWYLQYSGTSMASPNAAGASALIREYLTEVALRPEPQGALVKSLLILGAEDMGTRDIPNNNEGWGRVNLARSLTVIGDTGVWVDDRNFLRSGNSRDYSFNLSHGWQQFKVVLSWSDYRGNSWASTQLQNNLDLEVTSPSGTTYLGNVFNSGRSATGGSADDVNNVEVVLLDQAEKGVWNVRVSDVAHGGQRSEQPYALAIRGAGVDDLSPDAAFVPGSFSLSEPIPQVGEEVTFNVQVTNMGSRTMDDLAVRATSEGNVLGTQTITLGPGEVRGLNWQWTPASNGDNDVVIRLDPTDAIDELDEANNIWTETIGVTEPGVRILTNSVVKFVSAVDDSTAQWNLTLQNTALLPTNATIAATKPIRLNDGVQFNSWFQSFSQTTFELNGSESKAVGLTLVHPSPPEPGVYRFTVTATDVDNGLEYPITLTLSVPVLPGMRFTKTFTELSVSPLEETSFDVTLWNEGNGPQGWDLTLDAPSGWHVGFDSLGSTPGSPSASSGYLPTSASRVVAISISPPPNSTVAAGTSLVGNLRAVSQLDANLEWNIPLQFVVANHRAGAIEIESTFGELRPDSLLNLRYTIRNDGNSPMSLTAAVELPGGWSVTNQLPTVPLAPSESKSLVIGLQGNGLAASGPITLSMVETDGFRLEWQGYLQVTTSAQPRIAFSQVVLPDGTSATTPLGAGAHPVGLPGVHLIWYISNEGSLAFTPSTSLQLPGGDWMGICEPIGDIGPGTGTEIDCLVVLPSSYSAGDQPQVTMQVTVEDLIISNTVSLQVATTKQVSWNEAKIPETIVEGEKVTISIDLENSGNTPLSHRFEVDAPEGWVVTGKNLQMVELQPGEERTLTFDVLADSSGNGTLILSLGGADEVTGSSHELVLNIANDPSREVSSGGNGLIWGGAIILLLALIGGIGFAIISTKKESSPFDHSPPAPALVEAPTAFAVAPPPISQDLPPPPSLRPLEQTLPPAPLEGQESLPPAPANEVESAVVAEQVSVAGIGDGFGQYPVPPPPTVQAAQNKPTQAPPADAFTEASEEDSEEAAGEESEVISEAASVEVSEAIVEEVSEEPTGEVSEAPTGEISEQEVEEEEAEEDQSRHKCWVCLVGLPEVGWQACPSCGARYHLNGFGCAIDSLKGCRNCESEIGNFVKVE